MCMSFKQNKTKNKTKQTWGFGDKTDPASGRSVSVSVATN